MFELWELAPALLMPVLQHAVNGRDGGFDPLDVEGRRAVLEGLARWRPVSGKKLCCMNICGWGL